MNRDFRPRVRPLAALAVLLAALGLSGCFNPFAPRIAQERGNSKPPPVPSSAGGVLQLFEWCYNNKAINEYRELFTDDYRFYFSPLDSAGAEYRGIPFTREDELISALQLFVGGSVDAPPASSIRLALDRSFNVQPDPYYPWDPGKEWHSTIRTQVTLRIETSDGNAIDIGGAAIFYMIRGDSAVIPQELRDRGFGPDPTRWYIRRWDDETAHPEGGAFAARPGGDLDLSRWRVIGTVPAAGRASARVTAGAAPASLQTDAVMSWGAVKAYFRQVETFANRTAAARR